MIDYELHAEAEADLDAAALYYEDRVPGLGIALIDEVEQAIGEVREYPLAHPLWPDLPPELGIRRKLLGRFPYGLPFLLLERRVVVLAVAHLSREPGFWLRRARP